MGRRARRVVSRVVREVRRVARRVENEVRNVVSRVGGEVRNVSDRVGNELRNVRDRTIDEWSGINAAEEEARRRAEEEARLAAEEEARRKAEEEQRKREEEYKSRILKDQAGLESETASDTGDWSETGLGGVTVDTSASEVAPGIMEDTEDKMKKALRRFGKTKR